MPPDVLDFSSRAELAELMDGPCSREELRACLQDLARVNRWFLAYRPLLGWLDSLGLQQSKGPTRILDVGCGYGDGLRRIERWARERNVEVELTGIDLNRDAVAIAAEASKAASAIEWVNADAFAYAPIEAIDIVVSSLFTHHLAEPAVVRFIEWMERHATVGWFINDLSRNAVPYHLFRMFSKVMRLHPFVQHDGPVSIARAFRLEDWRTMCAAAGLADGDVSIRGYTPARLCVMRRKPLSLIALRLD
ncbi:MAG: methyltransferase domain-containing protein [Terracidiphilus sp.]